MLKKVLSIIALCGAAALAADPGSGPAAIHEPTTAPSHIVAATVYQGTALVTREVTVPEGVGLMELIVTPLPEQTTASSLYTEAGDGVRVLSTRFRTRAVQEDTRVEVRQKQEQIKTLQQESEVTAKAVAVAEQNQALLTKLENFTSASLQAMTDKGWFNGDATIALTKFIMATRDDSSGAEVKLQQKLQQTAEQIAFVQRQLAELTAGAQHTQRDAVITVDKTVPGAGVSVRLNYLVNAATWQPEYKIHTGVDVDKLVHVEYLASVQQQSGEDWGDIDVSLSTAEPMLNAAPPDLLALELTIGPVAYANGAPNGQAGGRALDYGRNSEEAKSLRSQAQLKANRDDYKEAEKDLNSASALEQSNELLQANEVKDAVRAPVREGPSVTFHLPAHYAIPSRSDPQLIEVARLDMNPTFYYKAVPVLTPHVFRLANLTNDTKYVLLPGEATMYEGKDFVGRMNLPLVAIGESFTAGFGVDPQVQVERTLITKTETQQGGNQVHTFTYRMRISNFKQEKVAIQVWDRLPKADSETVGVTLLSQTPELSVDPQYVREDRPKNLLRWDISVDKGVLGEKAATIDYQFKLEYARGVSIGNFKATQ